MLLKDVLKGKERFTIKAKAGELLKEIGAALSNKAEEGNNVIQFNSQREIKSRG